MANVQHQGRPVPVSPPVDFERLFVKGQEVMPGAAGGSHPVMNTIKLINLKGEVTAQDVAKQFNLLIHELKQAGYMAEK